MILKFFGRIYTSLFLVKPISKEGRTNCESSESPNNLKSRTQNLNTKYSTKSGVQKSSFERSILEILKLSGSLEELQFDPNILELDPKDNSTRIKYSH